jgi:hypothetical protein
MCKSDLPDRLSEILPVRLICRTYRSMGGALREARKAQHNVIASEAKQSSLAATKLDCFVASLLAMTL